MNDTEAEEVGDEEEADESFDYRDHVQVIKDKVYDLASELCDEYKDVDGRDMRSEVSWIFEQVGFGIHRQIEREKLERRQSKANGSGDR